MLLEGASEGKVASISQTREIRRGIDVIGRGMQIIDSTPHFNPRRVNAADE